MEIEHLLRMANQIGQFFDAQPDRAEALDGIAQHLRRFWEPRMRHALLAHVDARAGVGLDPIVAEALASHRAQLGPPSSATAGT